MKTLLYILAVALLVGCNHTTKEDIYGKAIITTSACSREYCETALRVVAPKEVEGLVASKSSLLGNAGDTLIVCVVRLGETTTVNLNSCSPF